MKKRILLPCCLLFACAAPACAADVKPHRSRQGTSRCLVRRGSHLAHRLAGGDVSRRLAPMTRPARRGWPVLPASLIDEGAGGLNARAFHGALADRAIQFQRQGGSRLYGGGHHHPERESARGAASAAAGADPSALRRRCGDAGARRRSSRACNRARPSRPMWRGAPSWRAFFNGHALWPCQPTARLPASPPSRRTICAASPTAHWVKGGLKIAIAGDINARRRRQTAGRHVQAGVGRRAAAAAAGGRLGQPGIHVLAMTGAAAHRDVRPAGHHARRSGFHARLCRQLHSRRRRIFLAPHRSKCGSSAG